MSRKSIPAHVLIERWLSTGALPRSGVERVFDGVPTNFPLRVRNHLPLFAHRSGAVAITIFGRVTALRQDWNSRTPAEQCALLRHEAEHVRQQRESPLLFYPRYFFGWLRGMMVGGGGRGARWHRAYRSIPYEVVAYAAEDEAARLLEDR